PAGQAADHSAELDLDLRGRAHGDQPEVKAGTDGFVSAPACIPARVPPSQSADEPAMTQTTTTVFPLRPLRPLLAYGCAALSGVLYWLAFPGVDAWPLAFVAWVP